VTRKNWPLGAIVITVFVLGFLGIANGQNGKHENTMSLDELSRQVAQMSQDNEKRRVALGNLSLDVARLKERMTAIEERLQPAGKAVPASKTAWRQLKRGMTEQQVRAILGEPVSITGDAVGYNWWYSEEGQGGPRVRFDGSKDTVWYWEEP